MKLIVFIILLKFISCLSDIEEYLKITRRPSSNSHHSADVFQLPLSWCRDNGDTECPLMGGRKIADCQCVCDLKDDKNVTYKSTFGFYDGKWKCENNTEIHRQAGSSLLKYKHESNDPIPATPAITNKAILFGDLRRNGRCFRNLSLSVHDLTYLKCDGTWTPLNHTIVQNTLIISSYWIRTLVKISRLSDQTLPLLKGRLIRLVFICIHQPSIPSQVLLLKVNGELNCPVSRRSSRHKTSTSPSSSPNTTPPASFPPTTPKRYNVANSDSSNTAHSNKMMSGIVTGSMMVIAVIIVIIILRCKRYIKYKENKRKRKQKTNEEDCGYVYPDVKHSGGGEVYENAYSSKSGCLLQDRLQDNREMTGGNPTAPNYANVDAVVNDSSAPKTSESIVSTELIYENLPEEQNDVPKITKERDDLGTSTPVDGNDPHVYGSLLGNDPHVYGSLNVPHKKPEDVDKQVTSTLPNKEDTYQQLNPIGQQSDGEYQALECKPERPNRKKKKKNIS